MPSLGFKVLNTKLLCDTSSLGYAAFCCLLIFTCYSVTEPGVPYDITVRARTAAGLGEPVSIVVFAVQQGNFKQTAEGCGQRVLLCSFKEYYIICKQCQYISHAHFECAIIAFPNSLC